MMPKPVSRVILCGMVIFHVAACGEGKPEKSNAGISAVSPEQGKKVTAWFDFHTGGDSMLAEPAPKRRIDIRIEYGDVRIRDVVAECKWMAGGNALGGGTERELEVAVCDVDAQNRGKYWLISEPGELTVRKGEMNDVQEIVAIYRMPTPETRAVAKEETR